MAVASERFDKTELTADEMRDLLAARVKAVYGLTLDQYVEARRYGKLPEVPPAAALALRVLSGEAACAQPEGR